MVETSDEQRKRLDLQDYGHEVAGLEAGRMARFGIGTARKLEVKEKERSERAYRNALDRLLLDPEYRRLYEKLGERLTAAETDADTAIAMIEEQLRLAAREIEIMESAAARDPDGKLVFQYADGRVVYADGSEVPAEIAAGIMWPEGAPSAEDYFAAKDRYAEWQVRLAEWQTYRNDVLGGIRDRYDDQDNPFKDTDDLKDALDRIEEQRPELTTSKVDPPDPDRNVATADLSALNKPSSLN